MSWDSRGAKSIGRVNSHSSSSCAILSPGTTMYPSRVLSAHSCNCFLHNLLQAAYAALYLAFFHLSACFQRWLFVSPHLHGISLSCDSFSFFSFKIFIMVIILFWLCWSSLLCTDFQLVAEQGLLSSCAAQVSLVQSTGSVVVFWFICSAAQRLLVPGWGLNPCPAQWQADS